jgi:hypothetical protein
MSALPSGDDVAAVVVARGRSREETNSEPG